MQGGSGFGCAVEKESAAEIASELYLSINTVKSHQRMVYRKLGADGRRDAVRRAKELRLL